MLTHLGMNGASHMLMQDRNSSLSRRGLPDGSRPTSAGSVRYRGTEQPRRQLQSRSRLRFGRPRSAWRRRAYLIIFEADTRAGRLFDLTLVVAILASVTVVIMDSVQSTRYGTLFGVLEWGFTLLFTVEYVLRLWCVQRPLRYARSALGIVDLLAVLPTYLAFFFPGLHALIDVRMLRLLRIFRILKLGAYVSEFGYLGAAMRASRRKIIVFIGFVLVTVTVMGTVMYVVEGPDNGFTNIPVAVYWCITTSSRLSLSARPRSSPASESLAVSIAAPLRARPSAWPAPGTRATSCSGRARHCRI